MYPKFVIILKLFILIAWRDGGDKKSNKQISVNKSLYQSK